MNPTTQSDILFSSSGAIPDDRLESALRQVAPQEWNEVIHYLNRHGTTPLFYAHVKNRPLASAIPAPVVQKLRSIYLTCAAFNTRLYAELSTILATLGDAGIKAIVLKGAYLAEIVYKNIALRPMCDIDLLIGRESLSTVSDLFSRLGYARILVPDTLAMASDNAVVLNFTKEKSVPIDVHLSIGYGNTDVDVCGLWERAVPVVVGSVQAWALSPEDQLCHTCFHAGHKHGFALGMLALCDLLVITRHFGSDIRWDDVGRRASEWNATRSVQLMLWLLDELLGVAVGEATWVKDPVPGLASAVATAKTILAEGCPATASLSPQFAKFLGGPKGEPMRVLRESFFPPREVIVSLYHMRPTSPLVYLYYFRRALDLVAKYGGALVRRVLRSDKRLNVWIDSEGRKEALRGWMESGDV